MSAEWPALGSGPIVRRMTQRAATVTQAELQAARDLLADYGLARPSLAAAIAAALADAREGATIPGERQQVGVTMRVHGMVWREYPERQADAQRRVRADWARRLQQAGMRPLGWPPITVTFWRWGRPGLVPPTQSGPQGMEQVQDVVDADMVELTISGEAVAL